jgi:hypothetical protein
MAAPLRELLAHVWPAIALGPIGSALVAQLVGVERGFPPLGYDLRPPSMPTTASSSGDPRPSSPVAHTAPSNTAPFFSAHGGGMGLLATVVAILASLVGVVALARLTVGEDFFSTRWLH